MENETGLSPLAELHLCVTPTPAGTLPVPARKLSWSANSSSTPRRPPFGRTSPLRAKSPRSNLFRRMNSAPSPTWQLLEDAGKENNLSSTDSIGVGSRKANNPPEPPELCSSQMRTPLEDHDTNSQDSGCSEDSSTNVRFAIPCGLAPRRGVEPSPGKLWLSSDESFPSGPIFTSPGAFRAAAALMTSPGSLRLKSMRSLSFSSTDSFDDGFSELSDLDKPDENAANTLGSLLTGPLITVEKCNENNSSASRTIRRAFSMVENTCVVADSSSDAKASKRPGDLACSRGLVKRRKGSEQLEPAPRHKLRRSASENCALSSTLNSLYGRPELIGDFSCAYVLPVIPGKHSDLTSITVDTLAAVIRGEFSSSVATYTLIDCRYPYEFEGGHIQGAKNLYTCEQIEAALLSNTDSTISPSDSSSGRNILIFHCEFSVARGPSMYRWLRRSDRKRSAYPSLKYPEVYLLHGGYQAFHQAHPLLCDPVGYMPMQDPSHESELRKFRSKSNTWTASRASFKRLQLL